MKDIKFLLEASGSSLITTQRSLFSKPTEKVDEPTNAPTAPAPAKADNPFLKNASEV